MALSREDKKDVKSAFGKALANKVSKVTRDRLPDYRKGEKEGMHQDFKGFHERHGTKGKTFVNSPSKSKALSKKSGKKDNRPLTGKGHDFYGSIEHDFTK